MTTAAVTDEATSEHGRFVLGSGTGAVEFLLPAGLSATPPEVETANAEAIAALDAAQVAGREYRAARFAAKRSTAADQRELAEKLALAELEAETANRLSRDTRILLARMISKCRGEWMVAQQSAIDAIRDELAGTLIALVKGLDSLTRERVVLGTLKSWPQQGSLIGVDFRRPASLDAMFTPDGDAAAAARVANMQGNMAGTTIPRSLACVVAELRRQISEQ